VAQVVDGNHRVGNRIVLESLGLADHQKVLQMNLFSVWRGWDRRIYRRILGERDACQDQQQRSEE
jgi:hypothetical protein